MMWTQSSGCHLLPGGRGNAQDGAGIVQERSHSCRRRTTGCWWWYGEDSWRRSSHHRRPAPWSSAVLWTGSLQGENMDTEPRDVNNGDTGKKAWKVRVARMVLCYKSVLPHKFQSTTNMLSNVYMSNTAGAGSETCQHLLAWYVSWFFYSVKNDRSICWSDLIRIIDM